MKFDAMRNTLFSENWTHFETKFQIYTHFSLWLKYLISFISILSNKTECFTAKMVLIQPFPFSVLTWVKLSFIYSIFNDAYAKCLYVYAWPKAKKNVAHPFFVVCVREKEGWAVMCGVVWYHLNRWWVRLCNTF